MARALKYFAFHPRTNSLYRMYSTAHPTYLHVRTPLHAGTGAELGVVDLPIQRERATGFPKVEGSSLKGAIREAFRHIDDDTVSEDDSTLLFGPDSTEVDLHAGALGFTDARLLCFPVKSARGVFAWITCPAVLRRWREDLAFAGVELDLDLPASNEIPSGSLLPMPSGDDEKIVILEEFAHTLTESEKAREVGDWIGRHVLNMAGFTDQLVVLDNDAFRDYVEMATEVITRTKINSATGTVATGQLFTEEYLPAESLLYFVTMASPLRVEERAETALGDTTDPSGKDVLSFFADRCPETIQIGANATIGKGLVRVFR